MASFLLKFEFTPSEVRHHGRYRSIFALPKSLGDRIFFVARG